MKISTDLKLFKRYKWRGLISECPYCDKEPAGRFKTDTWTQKDYVEYLVINKRHPNYRTDSVAMFSACAMCTKISWVHHKLNNHYYEHSNEGKWPEGIIKQLKSERTTRVHEAMLAWNASPCSHCSALEDVNTSYLYFARHCAAGSGGPIEPDEKCSKYVDLALRIARKTV